RRNPSPGRHADRRTHRQVCEFRTRRLLARPARRSARRSARRVARRPYRARPQGRERRAALEIRDPAMNESISLAALEAMRIAARVFELIRPELTGKPRNVQGAVLADVLAIWLAGHIVPGDKKATDALREDLLKTHLQQVRTLVEISHKIIHEPEPEPT